jgi:CRISPR-associated protein Cas1
MIKRTLFFANPFHLRLSNLQIKAENKKEGSLHSISIEDVGFIVLEHPQISITQSLISHLLESNVAILFCNQQYMPTGMALPFDGHHVQTQRIREQVNAGVPLKKHLWKLIVQQKIKNQGSLLKKLDQDSQALIYKASQVKSGDTSNEEGKAAAIYWPRLLGKGFIRDRMGEAPNNLLNYGYAILRAATCRAIVGTGLHPSMGLFHKNKYNSFALADDLMEPYRPYLDQHVHQYLTENNTSEDLDANAKTFLLEILKADVIINNKKHPMMIALSHTANSVAEIFAGNRDLKELKLPVLK